MAPLSLLSLVLFCIRCLDTCGADLVDADWRVMLGSRCEGSTITIGCARRQRLVTRSAAHTTRCVSTSGRCTGCTNATSVITGETARRCAHRLNCTLPARACHTCYDITGRLEYACVKESRFYPMCADNKMVSGVHWGVLYSDMFPAFITTAKCYMTIDVPPGWRTVVKPIYTHIPYPWRIDVCSQEGSNFTCAPPGETEHLGLVVIHVTDAQRTSFLLEFKVYDPSLQEVTHPDAATADRDTATSSAQTGGPTRDRVRTSPLPAAGNGSEQPTSSTPTPTFVHTDTHPSTAVTEANGVSAILPPNGPVSATRRDSALTRQDYVIIGMGAFLGTVMMFAVIAFVAVYRRSSDSSQVRRVVVLLGDPTKRLSRLSALFRMSALCANDGRARDDLRYSNPAQQAGRDLPGHPVATDESVHTALAANRLQQLSVLSDTFSSDSDRYERVTADILRKAGPPSSHRTLRTSELVLEAQLGHQWGSSPADRVQVQESAYLTKQPPPPFSDCGMAAHRVSCDPIYDVVGQPALAADIQPALPPTENSEPPDTSQAPWDLVFEEDDITIVENDHYADVH